MSTNETEATGEGQSESKDDSTGKEEGVVNDEEVQVSLSPDKDMNVIAENELEQLNKDIDMSLSSLGAADAVMNNVSIDHTQFPSLQVRLGLEYFSFYIFQIQYSGYIPLEFNFILIPCGMNIFQTKKVFPQCHVYKMAAQNKIKQMKISTPALNENFPR